MKSSNKWRTNSSCGSSVIITIALHEGMEFRNKSWGYSPRSMRELPLLFKRFGHSLCNYFWTRLRFSFFIRLRCHFHRIWPFFFHRRELRFIERREYWSVYKYCCWTDFMRDKEIIKKSLNVDNFSKDTCINRMNISEKKWKVFSLNDDGEWDSWWDF